MKKVIITGGSGFIGSHIIKKFIAKKYTVLNIDKLAKESQKINFSKNYFLKKCDLRDTKKLKKIYKQFDPDIVINCAAESHVDRSILSPKFFFDNNVIGTVNLLENILNQRKKIYFLQISTDEVFGSLNQNRIKFTEDSKYEPRSPYSASKASSDHVVRAYGETYKLDYMITNCSNNFGPYQYPEKFIPVVIKSCINRTKIPLYGNGLNIRDWIFVDDHVEAIFKLIKYGKKNNTYLIGANNEISNIKLAKKICKIYDYVFKTKNSKDLIHFIKDRKGHDFRYAIDSTKIKKHINWKPKISFDQGLFITINFYAKMISKLEKIFPYK